MVILVISANTDSINKQESHEVHNCFNKYTTYGKKQKKILLTYNWTYDQPQVNFCHWNLTIKKDFCMEFYKQFT